MLLPLRPPRAAAAAAAALLNLLLAAAAAADAMSHPDFQHLNVTEAIAEAITKPTSPSPHNLLHQRSHHSPTPDGKDRKLSPLNLLHRDLLIPNSAPNHGRRFRRRMGRDAKRVESLIHRLRGGGGGGDGSDSVEDFGSDVVSGMEEGSGEYLVRIGVGSPPRSQFMVIDSGSDMSWVQCEPCDPCYSQSDPIFDPSTSDSFAGVDCGAALCRRLPNSRCDSNRCAYEVSYRDGSYTAGALALETLTFGRTVIRDVAIGCGNRNRGMFIGAAGLLGLGSGSMSLVGQLSGQTGGAFSYCLVTRGAANATGSLVFGREALPRGAAWIPLLRSPRAPIFYYVGLVGLGVGGSRVPISEDLFRMTELGDGGVVMDTGTAVTRFPTLAYNAFRDAFVAQTQDLPRAAGSGGGGLISIFDTCYDLSGFLSVRVPTVSFYFSGGAILTLPARNFLIPVDEEGTFCFAFAGTESGFSIIGNVQQEGIQISFDGANGFVGFGPNVC